MASRTDRNVKRHPRRTVVIGALFVTCLSTWFALAAAEAAVTDDARAIPHDGNISKCPSGSTVLLQTSSGLASNQQVTTSSPDGKHVTLSFASSLTGAQVVAYVKGGPAYNEYRITVGTTDTTMLRSPFAKSGNLPGISHLLICQTQSPTTTTTGPSPQTPKPVIYVGYADDFHAAGGATIPFLPSPWQGDPSVVYVGCTGGDPSCGKFDAGAIRLHNTTSTTTMTLTSASVVIGPCTFTPWTALLPRSFGPGQNLILTQTGLLGPPMPAPCREALDPAFWELTNFDTSERPGDTREPRFYNCTGPGHVPVINLTFGDGTTQAVNDTARILNTGGTDSFACFGRNEAHPWTPIL